jgi:hypothetical protein
MYSVLNCHNVAKRTEFYLGYFWFSVTFTDVSKRALQLRKLIWTYSEDMYSVLNCHNVAKYTKFYLW